MSPLKIRIKASSWLSFALISALILSVWLMVHTNSHRSLLDDNAQTINAFVKDLSFTQFDKKGLIQSRLDTSYADHDTVNDVLHFQHPHLLVFTNERTPWKVDADRGESLKNNTEIRLEGNVILHQLPDQTHSDTLIKTQSLRFYPKSSLAENDEAVEIIQGNSNLSGVGLRADLKKGSFQLLRQSKGYYAAQKP